jgi:hypothetical protein
VDTVKPIEPPPGLIPVEVGKGCVLLLTEGEYLAGLRRGKQLRRREALARRTKGEHETYMQGRRETRAGNVGQRGDSLSGL